MAALHIYERYVIVKSASPTLCCHFLIVDDAARRFLDWLAISDRMIHFARMLRLRLLPEAQIMTNDEFMHHFCFMVLRLASHFLNENKQF